MKKLFYAMFLIVMLLCPISAFAYDFFFLQSPDQQNYPQLWIRGVTSEGEFTATIANQPDGVAANQYGLYDSKGLFGKIDPVKGEFEFMQAYEPLTVGWTMAFFGMSESGETVSLTWEKYDNTISGPVHSEVLRWDHAFNSLGFSSTDDVHVDSVVIPSSEGEPDWGSGFVLDINTNGRAVGFVHTGDAFSFNTNNGKFDYKYLANTGPYGYKIYLFAISDNSIAVGKAIRASTGQLEPFLLNVITDELRWIWDEDPTVNFGSIIEDLGVGNVAISNLNEIAYKEGNNITVWNFNTGQKWSEPIFNDPWFADKDLIYFTDMSSENQPNFVGYARVAGTDQDVRGWIAYP